MFLWGFLLLKPRRQLVTGTLRDRQYTSDLTVASVFQWGFLPSLSVAVES